jgi:hypothetical protein
VRPLVALLALLPAACLACSGNAPDSHDSRGSAAPLLPRVVETATVHWSGTWGNGRRVRYETATPITDVASLRQEAESIWTDLQPAAEADSICTVELKASAPGMTLGVPGTAIELSARRNFSFLVRHDSAGRWRWLPSAETPTTRCFD